MRLVASLRRFLAIAATLLFFASLIAGAVFAQSNEKELKAQADALLAKSYELSDIEAPGSPAFVLDATIHYQIGNHSADGAGQIIWTAPDHYREAYSAPNYFYTEIVRDGYMYLARTNNEMPLTIYELKSAIRKSMKAYANPKDKIEKLELLQVRNEALTCITLKSDNLFTECLDDSGDVARTELDRSRRITALTGKLEFGDFVAFGTKRFPRKIAFRDGDENTIDIGVKRLESITQPPGDAFNVPVDAMKETWCSEPTLIDPDLPRDPFSGAIDLGPMMDAFGSLRASGASSLYLVIDPNGHARAVTIIHLSKPIPSDRLRSWMTKMRFSRMRCGKDGIEYQTEVTFVK